MFARCFWALCLFVTLTGASGSPNYSEAAQKLDEIIEQTYAYLDKLPDNTIPQSSELAAKRKAVSDKRSLLRYAEDRIASLADHHAITGSSFSDSWAVIPTYADLWISARDGHFIVDAVRDGSPAMKAGVQVGDIVTAVEGVATATAVKAFWAGLGLAITPRRSDYAARVLAAGRRDRVRVLTIRNATGSERTMTLPSLYSLNDTNPPLTIMSAGNRTTILVNNSLGNEAMIAAFDAAMAKVPINHRLFIDLRDTPSGGNTTVARAVMGWFVKRPTGYQIHIRPEEERETGIPRQWIEQVLPRKGKFRGQLPTVLVGRWTGSMGEGLAIGFAALGADVEGTKMAELNGAVEDVQLGDTGVSIKLPTERLMTTRYLPREDFVPTAPR